MPLLETLPSSMPPWAQWLFGAATIAAALLAGWAVYLMYKGLAGSRSVITIRNMESFRGVPRGYSERQVNFQMDVDIHSMAASVIVGEAWLEVKQAKRQPIKLRPVNYDDHILVAKASPFRLGLWFCLPERIMNINYGDPEQEVEVTLFVKTVDGGKKKIKGRLGV